MIFPETSEIGQGKAQAASANASQQPLNQAPPAYGATYYSGAAGLPVIREVRPVRNAFSSLFSWSRGEWTADPTDYPIPKDVQLSHCVPEEDGWTNIHDNQSQFLPYTAEAHFDLPLNSESLYFVERGDLSGGTATIKVDDKLEEDHIHVKVAVNYQLEKVRDWAKVCEVTRNGNTNGVGIFTPRFHSKRPWNARLSFDITISLPSSAAEHVIKKFTTEFPNTSHHIEKLPNFSFDEISLLGTNGGITADALSSTKGTIITTNGRISGVFNTTDSLTLTSTNGKIDVAVGAAASTSPKTQVVLGSTNGHIQAALSLTSDNGEAGRFDVVTSTSNSALDVEFVAQPVGSVLSYKGSTTNARARLSLNPAFEGQFYAHTTNAKADAVFDHSVSDPSGKGRRREVSVSHVSKNRDVYGSAYWSPDHNVKGDVIFTSTNGRVKIEL
ncbi:hypothetical protein CVT24_007358 [Panaeolus cyanescens]|uniref:Uncharacterized protein n=1 Tax=Panaeolus cyanescens TaxID=181874 RepID=A0A409YL04_9AGAR|nr:hypothetical protein CVT24_007358 [Panaeolus cyanescens]